MLSRFFKPKWQHRDAAVRRRAMLESGEDGGKIALELALHDPDTEVRCAALKRVADLLLLERILAEAKNPRVREQARERLLGLISGSEPGLSAEQRAEALERNEDMRLLEHVARQGCDAKLRALAVVRVGRQPLLFELAASDPSIDVRLLAVQRVEAAEHLQQLCKQSRGRDKRLYRAAKERLEQRLEAEQRPQQIQQGFADLCIRAEALLKSSSAEAAEAALKQLQAQWLQLVDEAPPEEQHLDRFAEAVVAIGEMERAQRQQAAALKQDALAVTERLQALQDGLEAEKGGASAERGTGTGTGSGQDEARLKQLGAELDQCQQAWLALAQAPDEALQASYRSLSAGLRDYLKRQGRALGGASRLQAALQRAESALAGAEPITAKVLDGLTRALPRDAGDALPQPRIDKLMAGLKQRLNEQREQADARMQRVGGYIGELEQALEQGESRQAASLLGKIYQLESELRELGAELSAPLRQRMQRLAGRLRELRDWERFSNTTEREQLCERAEALVGADMPVPELAKQIKQARKAWNALGSTDREAIKALRERFNQACEKAYEPCAVFYREQAQQRAANLAERSALCERLESYIAETDWESAAIRDVDRVLREARDAWKKIGPVDREGYKKVSGPYHRALDTLGAHLRKARAANLQLKKGLLNQAEALTDEAVELERAMDGIRDLQTRWKAIGPAPRREEQVLWKRFKQAGDAVFARRNSERDAHKQAQEADIAAREAICGQMQALVDGVSDAQDNNALRAACREIEQAWSDAPELPKRAATALQQRFSNAREQLDAIIAEREAGKRASQLVLSAEAALLVAAAETANGDEGRLEPLRQQWQTLLGNAAFGARTSLPRQLLEQRWQRAQATQGDAASKGSDAAALLCLQMEIEAGVASPPEAAGERMKLQVKRLNQGFGGGDAAAPAEQWAGIDALEQRWWQLPGIAADRAEPLTRRFLLARDAGYRATGVPLPLPEAEGQPA